MGLVQWVIWSYIQVNFLLFIPHLHWNSTTWSCGKPNKILIYLITSEELLTKLLQQNFWPLFPPLFYPHYKLGIVSWVWWRHAAFTLVQEESCLYLVMSDPERIHLGSLILVRARSAGSLESHLDTNTESKYADYRDIFHWRATL